jgi:hypothetical protein
VKVLGDLQITEGNAVNVGSNAASTAGATPGAGDPFDRRLFAVVTEDGKKIEVRAGDLNPL